MKLNKLMFLFVLAAVAMGCSKDDDGTPPYNYSKENLTGTYNLIYLENKEVETINVNGFDVVTTTTQVGDTFNVATVFASNNTVTADGTYRVTETVSQNGQTNTQTYIIDLDNETTGYSVNSATNQLTIDGSTYTVHDFSPTGFRITLSETTTESNGDHTVYTEEMRFSKQ